jgi:MGT family glycosyltransferase
MTRFLLTVWPFVGHINPNLALAEALRARGHEVAFYTGAPAAAEIARRSFLRFPLQETARQIAGSVGAPERDHAGTLDHAAIYERMAARYTVVLDRRLAAQRAALRRVYHEWFMGTVPAQVADIEGILAAWHPDVIVSDPFMWAPFLVLRETQPVPVAIFSYFAGCLLPGRDAPPFGLGLPRPNTPARRALAVLAGWARDLAFADLRRAADAVRRGYGLPPLPSAVMAFAAEAPLYLIASAPEFDYARRDLPPSAHYVGPCLLDAAPAADALVDAAPPARPLVYVTDGTAYTATPTLLRAACAGLADLPLDVLITTGRSREPAALGLGRLAPNIRVEQWADYGELLPRLSLMVSHGGSGTVLAGLRAGLPQLVVPSQWDQRENAQRVSEAGVGLWLPIDACTSARLRAAAERVLGDPRFGQAARRMALALSRYGGAARAAELLERLSPLAAIGVLRRTEEGVA